MGPVGTGKSFFAGCIANALLEQGERVMMTNFSRILDVYKRQEQHHEKPDMESAALP